MADYALGQVAVLAFQEPYDIAVSVKQQLDTVLVCEPRKRPPFFKLPGGMIEEIADGDRLREESPEEASTRELQEETGVWCPPENFTILSCGYRNRRPPYTGQFPVYLMLGHSANFSRIFDPRKGEFGEDGEETIITPYGNVFIEGFAWDIPSQPDRRAEFFPYYRKMLKTANVA